VTQSTRPKKKKEYARFTKGGDDVEIPETDEAAKKEEIARERGGGGGGAGVGGTPKDKEEEVFVIP